MKSFHKKDFGLILKVRFSKQIGVYLTCLARVRCRYKEQVSSVKITALGTLRSDNGDVHEKVTEK